MEKKTAVAIIEKLANGVDPHSGVVFASDSPYQHPDTVRALLWALGTFETGAKRPAADSAPQNAGKPWSAEEDEALVTQFDGGAKVAAIAAEHHRSGFAIQTRLAKLGKIAPPPNMRGPKVANVPAAYNVTH